MFKVPEKYRLRTGTMGSDSSYGNNGVFILTFRSPGRSTDIVNCVASDGEGWEHVSVGLRGRKAVPPWDIMCKVKDLFWDEEDCVIQFHPPKSQYVNYHPGILHLWRPVNKNVEIPPTILVGPKK